jgi:hypothetical protein
MKPFKDFINESADIHKAAGDSNTYKVTHSPDHDHKHITLGHGHGIKVVVHGGDKTATEHREIVKKNLADAGHRVAHTGILHSSPEERSFHLTVFGKGK